jgi:hypothetical protein
MSSLWLGYAIVTLGSAIGLGRKPFHAHAITDCDAAVTQL